MVDASDLEIAYAVEAEFIKVSGLQIPGKCSCTLQVRTSYPGKPWYFVRLFCAHTLRKIPPNLNVPLHEAIDQAEHGWFTVDGRQVSVEELAQAFDAIVGPDPYGVSPFQVMTSDGYQVARFGAMYVKTSEVPGARWRYVQPINR